MMIRRRTTCKWIRTLSSVFKLNQTCFKETSVVTSPIFEYNQWTKHHSSQWKSSTSLRPKKSRQSQKSKVILITFFDVRGHRPQRVLAIAPDNQSASLRGDSAAYASPCASSDRSCVRKNCGCFIQTMHLLTTPCVSSSFCPRGTSSYWNNLFIHLILLRTSFFFSFSQAQGDYQGDLFWRCWDHQRGRNDGEERHPRVIPPAVRRSVTEKDGKVH